MRLEHGTAGHQAEAGDRLPRVPPTPALRTGRGPGVAGRCLLTSDHAEAEEVGFPDAGQVAHLLKELTPRGLHLWEGQEALRAQSRVAPGRAGVQGGAPPSRAGAQGPGSGASHPAGSTLRVPGGSWADSQVSLHAVGLL